MRNTITYLLIVLFFITLNGQSQIPYAELNEKGDICNHIQNFKNRKAESSNPLLDYYDIKFTKIDIETDNTSDYIEGSASITAVVTADELSTFCIELSSEMFVESVIFNEVDMSIGHTNDEILIYLENPLQNGDIVSLQIDYSGHANDLNNYAGGLHHKSGEDSFNDEDITYTFTQPFGANLWFPCKQVLNDKIDSLHFFITTNSNYKVSANGLLTNTVELPNNKTRYEWKTKYPIAYYLVAFNIFNYAEYNFYTHPEGFDDSIFIQNFMIDQTHIDAMKEQLDKTNDVMNMYCNLFGMYPFKDEKYGHSIWAKGFGMEHQTITSMPYNIDFRRLSHELSHQWFGNSVTCGSWQDIWLNEGFASYFDYLALKHLSSNSIGENRMAYYHNKAMQNPNGSVYVPDEDADDAGRIFDYKLSYCKGAAVVKMLRFELQNDELFWQIIHNYLAEFKDSFSSTAGLQQIVEETSNRDFSIFFEQWIYGEGYPTYYGQWYQDTDTLFIRVNQRASYPSATPLFTMLMQYKLNYEGGDTLILLRQESKRQVFKIYMPQTVNSIIIDPDNETLNKDNGLNYFNFSAIDEDISIPCDVYPNPFSNKVRIAIPPQHSHNYILELYDINGRRVYHQSSSEQEYILNTAELKSGIYLLHLIFDKGIFHQKLIKN